MILISPAPFLPSDRALFDAEFQRRQSSPTVASLRAELQASGLRERDADAYRQRAFELSVAGYFAHPERSANLTPFRVQGRVQPSTWASVDGEALMAALPACGYRRWSSTAIVIRSHSRAQRRRRGRSAQQWWRSATAATCHTSSSRRRCRAALDAFVNGSIRMIREWWAAAARR